MTDINKIIDEEYQRVTATSTGTTLAELGPVKGISDVLSRKYVVGERASEMFVDDPNEWGNVVGENLPIIYGKTLIRPQPVDQGVARDGIDPSLVLREYQFVVGEGPNGGIATDGGSENRNILINGKPIENEDGSVNYGKLILKQVAGLAAGELIKEAAGWLLGDEDPVTGKQIEGTTGKVKMEETLGQLADVSVGGAQALDILTYNADGECGWKAAPFVKVFEESGIKIEPLIVQENGTVKAPDTVIWNFIGATVTYDEANRRADITVSGGGSGGGGGGGSTEGPVRFFICEDPPSTEKVYHLKRDGVVVASATNCYTRHDVARNLATSWGVVHGGSEPRYSVGGPPAGDVNYPVITIGPGYDPCLTDIGTWSLTDDNGNPVCLQQVTGCSAFTPSF